MFVKAILAGTFLAASVAAHTNIRGLYNSGAGQAYPTTDWGYCMRPVRDNNPFLQADWSSSKVNCNYVSGPAAGVCTAMPGDQMTLVIHEHGMSEDYAVHGAHHGPIQIYLAKVSDATTVSGDSALKWFKIYSRGLIHGGVDRGGAEAGDVAGAQYWATNEANSNKGLVPFTLPSDLAPGDYLLRGELIALHNAGSTGGAQPYFGCAQLRVGGNGNGNPATVSLSYNPTDPGILINIHQTLNSYTPPGPAVYVSGGGSTNPQPTTTTTTTTRSTTTSSQQQQPTTTTIRITTTTTTRTQPTTTTTTTSSGSGGNCAPKYAQCGGQGYSGLTCCQSGSTCKYSNAWYSQCL
ncbi:hypothetical protein HDV00_002493 [Rhizophlyctis rosea]|nr:hypothetical protein HDV00_002493 [Rhizophlyctis rosea]